MRVIFATVAAIGGALLAASFIVCAATGAGSEAAWIAIGPLPFYAVALVGFLRRPDNRVVWWLLGLSVAFLAEVTLGDIFLPMAARHLGTTSSVTAALAIVRQWAGTGTVFAGVGLIGLFPSGRVERSYERAAMWVVGLVGLLCPLIDAVSASNVGLGDIPEENAPIVRSALSVHALSSWGGPSEFVYRIYPFWMIVGLGMLALRYLRSAPAQRRQIRWLLLGTTVSLMLWIPLLLMIWWLSDVHTIIATIGAVVLTPLALTTTLGSLLGALFYTGVFGIDEPSRRRLVRLIVGASITVLLAVLAVCAGLLVSLIAPVGIAVVVAVVVAIGCEALRRRLVTAADRWVFGARLAGYARLSRFGESLTRTPGSIQLLGDLAGEIRRSLDLTWARVCIEPTIGALRTVTDGTPTDEVAAAVPIAYHGITLGRIECGLRRDGPLLDEDRRLLAYFAAQAGAGIQNLHLDAELRHQTRELAASRDRVVQAQDVERRRIQQVLHDGVQQEIVALSAKIGLIRAQLRRGDTGVVDSLESVQRDLAAALRDVREIAYAIHPPVLSDRGLLEAVEAQASRLAVPMAVRADASLRGVRFPEHIESTAWYVLAEALTNVVKHARATEVEVSLDRQDGSLGLVIRDDGCGFDSSRPRGLGLAGLTDRLDTVGGSVMITSSIGLGTSVRVHIPVDHGPVDHGPVDREARGV